MILPGSFPVYILESDSCVKSGVFLMRTDIFYWKCDSPIPVEQKKNQFVVCFKSSGESVFELAKRYAVPVDKITDEAEKDLFVIIER